MINQNRSNNVLSTNLIKLINKTYPYEVFTDIEKRLTKQTVKLTSNKKQESELKDNII